MFKSILNTLQKNVIGATIFGKLPIMSTSEETILTEPIPLIDVNEDPIPLIDVNEDPITLIDVIEDPITLIDVIEDPVTIDALSTAEDADPIVDILADYVEPLSDPLALDDNSISTELAQAVNPILTDLNTPADGQIILIDVNILRHSEQNELLNSRETQTEDLIETIEEGVPSDGSDSGVASDGSSVEVRPQIPEIVAKRSCLKRRSSECVLNDNPKRVKRNIKFDSVNVFYFQRMQGNSCVPSQGGCTLGMARHHMHNRKFSLAEHAAEQRRRLQDMNTNNSSTDDTDTEDEPSENSGSDLDTESNGFLQPVLARQRRFMLKTAGVLKIDTNEKDECRDIRTSREFCGCSCRGYCDPDTCSCSQSGIQCQVDRSNFPCGCSLHGCDNVVGRVEFDPERVRIHFIHTILRLELENKQNRSEEIVFKNDVSRQWHPQARPPISTTNSISDFSNLGYNPVFENLSHRTGTSLTSTDESMKDYDRVVQAMPSLQESNNLLELANRSSDDDSLNLHYDYRNDDYSTESIINSNVIPDIIGCVHTDLSMANSFSSTFSEFVERTYNLGGTDNQHHSPYLSSSHSGSSTSCIVDSANLHNIPYELCDEPIPNSDNSDIIPSSLDNIKKPVDVTYLLENDGEFQTNNVINSSETEIDDCLPIDDIEKILNNEIDVEQEIPVAMVNVEKEDICKDAINKIEESSLTSLCDEDKNELSNL